MPSIDSEGLAADPQYSDETLLQFIAQHKVNALQVFYDRHVHTIYSLIKRIVRERTTADEVLQETFLQVWQKAGEFRGEGSAAAWLHRIARNKSLDRLRSQKARPQVIDTTLMDAPHGWSTPAAIGPVLSASLSELWLGNICAGHSVTSRLNNASVWN